MKAGKMATELMRSSTPRIQTEEESQWTGEKVSIGSIDIDEQRALWHTEVPGSRAPDHVFLGAIQATENQGRDVSEAEALIPILMKAYEEHDDVTMLKYTAKVLETLSRAPKIAEHPYWKYKQYQNFAEYVSEIMFPQYPVLELGDEELFEKIHAGWQAQIAGAALGTMIEGYCSVKLREVFGEINGYLRKPSTDNDDILFELAFLFAVCEKGIEVTSEDIGLEWIGRIEYTWSAEAVAFKNMKRGVFPPKSAKLNNPWNEWIGAQMRGSVCGLVAPGNPRLAASLAWTDGVISHVNNGVLGEVFNAVLSALAFVESEVQVIVKKAIDLIPAQSEYYTVVKFALDACEEAESWEPAWRKCEEKYKYYNWIHTYPNAAAEVVALYFSENSFDTCMHVIAMCGQDVDCNAGQIGTIFGIIHGYKGIDKRWTEPFQDRLDVLFRGYEHKSITDLAKLTMEAAKKLQE